MANTPGACPPGQFDVQGATDCVSMLQTLYAAYISAITGKTRTVVRFNDRWSEYSKADAPTLLATYTTLYAQCPGAQTSGLPNLNPGLSAKRGRPGRGFFAWPRL